MRGSDQSWYENIGNTNKEKPSSLKKYQKIFTELSNERNLSPTSKRLPKQISDVNRENAMLLGCLQDEKFLFVSKETLQENWQA